MASAVVSRSRVGGVLLVCLCLAGSSAASAATIHVNTTADVVANDGRCSLREAIMAANQNARSGQKRGECAKGAAGSADRVDLRSKNYPLSSLAGALNIDGDVFLLGEGRSETRISGTGVDRILDVMVGVEATVSKLTVRGGTAPDGASGFELGGNGGAGGSGGGIRNSGTLRLSSTVVEFNSAGRGGLGLPPEGSSFFQGGPGGFGGGIYNTAAGLLVVKKSTITRNGAGWGGDGGASAGDSAGSGGIGGQGGGIFNVGRATIKNSVVEGNSAGPGGNGGAGGAGFGSPSGVGGGGGLGGGIANRGFLTLSGVVLFDNDGGHGGDAGSSGASGGRGGLGGAIFTTGNTQDGGVVKLKRSTVAGNFAGTGGLNLPPGSGSAPDGSGGGIFSDVTELTISASTISGNVSGGDRAGIAIDHGDVAIRNSTIAANQADGFGGGIDVTGFATVLVNNTTIAYNRANADNLGTEFGGGLQNGAATTTITVRNSISASNSVGLTGGSGTDCAGFPYTSGGHNVIGSSLGCSGFTGPGDVLDKPARLGVLANNGGPTRTIALRKGSPAINNGANATCEQRDQRGIRRPKGPRCDSGSYERGR